MRRRVLRMLVTVALAAPVVGLAAPAHADYYSVTQCPATTWYHAATNESVEICQYVDIDYLGQWVRGHGEMTAYDANGNEDFTVHVQIDSVHLSYAGGAGSTQSGSANSQSGYVVQTTTAVAYHNCEHYGVRVYYGIRWSDGVLTGGQYTRPLPFTAPCPSSPTTIGDLPAAPEVQLS